MDPLQSGEIRLHLWMLYTSQAPILDLTGEHIKTKEDIEATFHTLNLCPKEDKNRSLMAEKIQEEPANQSSLSHLKIAILLMIPKLILDLKPQSKKDNTIPSQDQLWQFT